MEKPFFNFELFTPIVMFENQDLSNVIGTLFDSYEVLPMSIIYNKGNPVFESIVDERPEGGSPIVSVIIPIRYLNQFIA